MEDEEKQEAGETAISLELPLIILGGFLAGVGVVYFLYEDDPAIATTTAIGAFSILFLLSVLIWALAYKLRA